MATLEQAEKLCAMANITYAEAKTALDAANGDLLDAIVYLEKQGKVQAPAGSGYYSSAKAGDAQTESSGECSRDKQQFNSNGEHTFGSFLKKACQLCLRIIRKGNANSFQILSGEEVKAAFPLTILALLLIFAFWVTIPLIIIGLFFGLRYRFVGPDFGSNKINQAMDNAADAAQDFKKSMNV